MSELLAHKIAELRATGVRLFELLDEIKSDAGSVASRPTTYSDFALANVAHKILRQRRGRSEHLPPELFSEPAWDMLLDLFIAQMEQKKISVTSVCLVTPVPTTTALRWLDVLQSLSLIERHPSADDKRVTFVRLSREGRNALRRYLSAICDEPAIRQMPPTNDVEPFPLKLVCNG